MFRTILRSEETRGKLFSPDSDREICLELLREYSELYSFRSWDTA